MNAIAHARDVDLARAAELARAGDHDAAQRILEGLGRAPATLDLLARVHAQRGDLAAARAAWAEVLSGDPAHVSALAGTRLIDDITAGRRRAHPVPVALIGGSAALVAVALAAVLLPASSPDGEPPAAQEPATQSPAIRSSVPAATQPVAATPDPELLASLAAPEVRLTPAGTGVRVVFARGMFGPDSTALSQEGREQLQRWGRLLRGKRVRVTVFGHGVVVPGGPVTGGSATAVARAAAAVEVLAAAGEQPPAVFVLRSAEQSDAPHTGADPAPNRTVTLRVDPW
ncbi:hypothetical protein SAMN05216188_105205 [Lentzea xinjiangensis]|uniref:Uncharacterized protein n=1 Tax=Lentzea xinjiangensis TaxID=402600 RepID=A0A1H9J441_9PSEU|nr:hypothetical protein [Lentzea xinjiangensis]SEQ81509.1 hypothetical protein SAMN05216188_105205 [Lentzea xinjiangensis]